MEEESSHVEKGLSENFLMLFGRRMFKIFMFCYRYLYKEAGIEKVGKKLIGSKFDFAEHLMKDKQKLIGQNRFWGLYTLRSSVETRSGSSKMGQYLILCKHRE